MKKIKQILLMLTLGVMAISLTTGCQEKEIQEGSKDQDLEEVVEDKNVDEKENQEDEEIRLKDWEGEWNNLAAYLDDEELEDAFVELAEREDITIEEAKEAYLEKRKADFDAMVIDADSVSFLNAFKDDGGEEISRAKYKYKEAHTVKHGNFEMKWYVFDAEGDAEYKYLLLMPIHGVETLTHFHMRYGDNLEDMLENEEWYPTFVKPSSTYDQLYEEITE